MIVRRATVGIGAFMAVLALLAGEPRAGESPDHGGNAPPESPGDTRPEAQKEGKGVAHMLEKYPGHVPDGVIGDRRLRPAHYLQLDVLATSRNFIQIWLPELCTYEGAEKPFYLLGTGAVHRLQVEDTERGGVSLTGRVGDEVEFTGTAEEFKYGLVLTVAFRNLSPKTLRNVSATVCVQLTAAPDFRDPDLERTFWLKNGQWATFQAHSGEQEGRERWRFYSAGGGELTLPLIVVDSQNGPHAVGLIFRDASEVAGNAQMSTGCIHSSGGSYHLQPGGTAVQEGILIIHPEGKEAVLKLAREFWGVE